jgi:cytochrome c-type biogenesis protein CcmH
MLTCLGSKHVFSARKLAAGPRFFRALCLLSLITATSALAVEPDEILKDPLIESRARKLSTELRCLVCQNQSIDDSNAPLARDLRVIVREQLSAGKTDAQVMDHIVQRYGEFVLLRPRFNATTLLLWLAPLLLLAGGVVGIVTWARSRSAITDAPLSITEQERLNVLLENSRKAE